MSRSLKKIDKILVANRGEIAIRILRAASELKIRTVAMYTYEDRYSLHRYKADEAYQIGEDNDPLKPYLDIEEIISLAKRHKIDAIHPGYGFLSENVNFVRRCKEEGIIFIGPEPEVMERLGDKVEAKKIAVQAKVPIIEASKQELTSPEIAEKEAKKIGFPVMVKAAAGGGGRGMRVVRQAKDLKKSFNEARGEAKKAFGDDTIFIEKFIDQPKHIEVQLMGDNHGNVVHLFERDCSVQRRFQKVVEVAPNITLSKKTKQKIYDYAIKIAKAVNYNNVGTVEFLVDKDEGVYFIEVNPRVQVEHTITEEVTGIDIVRSQILIARGHKLSDKEIFIKSQDQIKLNGVAIQCRVTTEDPKNGFQPDFGTIIAYRNAGGFGIRTDEGSAYPGSRISPFFDSMLVKVTSSGRTLWGTAGRLKRALSEFRIRGVKTNIGFLENVLNHPTFIKGECTVNFIADNPDLFDIPKKLDRGTKSLSYIANVIVNGNPDVKFIDPKKEFKNPVVPAYDRHAPYGKGTKDLLVEKGPEKFAQWLKDQKEILFTDTTFRDAHQSLLATRMRTIDMMAVAESFAKNHPNMFSMEVWGGATFDASMRFLHESPWKRLEMIREAVPNILLQMLLRGSNAVGYKAYPDNLIEAFIEEAAKTGIDVFRIFDSLNWVDAMKVSIKTVRERTNSLAEVAICYTGDILDPERTKYDLQYYLDLARRLEDEGAHILAIKDMAGLLKPLAAEKLITELKKSIDIPIHLHTHDTSSVQPATYLKAIDAGVDVVDCAIGAMSGKTSQPNFDSVVAMLEGHEREPNIDFRSLDQYSVYWEIVRDYYYPFESSMKSGSASVYEHEMPGGQYTNLRAQAESLGLGERFKEVEHNYSVVNQLFGDIVKVTPSSKVVGDMALFMTSNDLTEADIMDKRRNLAFPESVKSFLKGDLGQPHGGFPEKIQKIILKDEKPYTGRPNEHLTPIDFKKEFKEFKQQYGKQYEYRDFLSAKLYPRVFDAYHLHLEQFGEIEYIPTPVFFYGLKSNDETIITIAEGKTIIVKLLYVSEANEEGNRTVFFELNGQTRRISVKDNAFQSTKPQFKKADEDNEIGAPIQGKISSILVKKGDKVKANTSLFVIEAMKMETTISSPLAGVVKEVHIPEGTLVEQDDMIIELE